MHTGMLPCLVPSWLRRSDLVLNAGHFLDFLSSLVLQACISFCSVSDKSGALLYSPCSRKNAVAHVLWVVTWVGSSAPGHSWCGVRKSKMGSPMWSMIRSPNLRRLANVQSSFSPEAFMAVRGG